MSVRDSFRTALEGYLAKTLMVFVLFVPGIIISFYPFPFTEYSGIDTIDRAASAIVGIALLLSAWVVDLKYHKKYQKPEPFFDSLLGAYTDSDQNFCHKCYVDKNKWCPLKHEGFDWRCTACGTRYSFLT